MPISYPNPILRLLQSTKKETRNNCSTAVTCKRPQFHDISMKSSKRSAVWNIFMNYHLSKLMIWINKWAEYRIWSKNRPHSCRARLIQQSWCVKNQVFHSYFAKNHLNSSPAEILECRPKPSEITIFSCCYNKELVAAGISFPRTI